VQPVIGSILAADAIYSAITIALALVLTLGHRAWLRRRARGAPTLDAHFCRHCPRCFACTEAGPGPCIVGGAHLCDHCRHSLHLMPIPPGAAHMTDPVASLVHCLAGKHADLEILPMPGDRKSMPPPTMRYCRTCGAIHRKGKWILPTALRQATGDVATLSRMLDEADTLPQLRASLRAFVDRKASGG
jgi:hypothetical protein